MDLSTLINRLTPSQKNIIVASLIFILTILIVFSFWFYLYKPKNEELAALKKELEQKTTELEGAQALALRVVAQERIKLQKEEELKKLEQGLPEEEYIPTLLTQIENLANETRVKIASLSPGEPVAPAPPTVQTSGTSPGSETPVVEYKEISLNFPFVGTYESLKNFLNRLATFSLVIVINSVQISKTGETDLYDGTPVLNVGMPATVYILPKRGEEVEKQQSK